MQDRAILAVQDLANSLQWPILELATSRVVLTGPKLQPMQMYDLPKITILLNENNHETEVSVTVSQAMPDFGGVKKKLTGIMGQIVNGLSVRIQTNSISINPTVAVGEGQGGASNGGTSRIDLLERLQKLRNDGTLTQEEFDVEKQKILGNP